MTDWFLTCTLLQKTHEAAGFMVTTKHYEIRGFSYYFDKALSVPVVWWYNAEPWIFETAYKR